MHGVIVTTRQYIYVIRVFTVLLSSLGWHLEVETVEDILRIVRLL